MITKALLLSKHSLKVHNRIFTQKKTMYSLYKNTSHIVLVHYLLLSGGKIENKQIEIVKGFYMGFYKGFAFYMTFSPKNPTTVMTSSSAHSNSLSTFIYSTSLQIGT